MRLPVEGPRDLAQAGEPAADRLVQDPRRGERDPPGAARGNRRAASSPRAPATWRRASRGRHASSACRRRSSCRRGRRRRSSTRSPGSAGRRCRFRTRSGGRRSSTHASTAPRGSSSTPSRTSAVMAGNGTIGLELAEQLCRDGRRRARSVGRRRALHRDRQRPRRARVAGTKVYAVEPETGAPLEASLAAGEPRPSRLQPVVRGRRGQPGAAGADVGARTRAARRLGHGHRSTRRPRPCGCSPSAHAWSPRAPAPSPSLRRPRAACRASGSSASSRAGTSTPPGSSRSCAARRRG